MDLNVFLAQNHNPGGIAPSTIKIPNTQNLEDSQLWSEFQAGSEVAFSTIYRQNVSSLFSYGIKLVRDKELIKDCIQDLFIDIWNSRERLTPVKSIKSYLFKSIRRRLIAEAVKNRNTLVDSKMVNSLQQIEIPHEEIPSVEKEFGNQEQVKLKNGLERLTNRQKEIIYLKFFSRLSYSEISDTMDLSMKGTYKLMGRSIRFLRKYMHKDAKVEVI